MPKIRQALFSVSDKTGIVDFGRELQRLGVKILSTGGTAKVLRDAGLKVEDVSEYTGSPEILDGRLKTLHPKIHGGLLGMRGNRRHLSEMKANGIEPIDLVVVNLYPFEQTINKKNCSFEDAVENIDIGGPTMLRAAAKNWQDVAVVVEPSDYQIVIDELKKGGEVSQKTCFALAQKVFALTARYDAAICNYWNSLDGPSDVGRERFPRTLALIFNKAQALRYGENPHQRAAFYVCPRLPKDVACVSNGRQLHGKELSYNNIMDADAAIELAAEFYGRTAAVIIKHTNPCGVAISKNGIAEAFVSARECDPTSAFGGIVALTKPVDAETARAIGDTFFEVIIAPGFDAKALEMLKAKKNLRLLEIPSFKNMGEVTAFSLRKVRGGLLVQDYDDKSTDVSSAKVVTKRSPKKEEIESMEFAWRVVKHVKSNAIVVASKDRLLGIGAGQTSRIDSARIAIEKAASGGARVMASDAFFPFRDCVDLAARAGIGAIVQPGGSIHDDDSIKACDEHGIAMVFTGIRHFRH
jgi:phosphoribosylaminoimidazolecarboxamide formyltransferase/IMP cyclohydrolase